jgi:hypothetical protein
MQLLAAIKICELFKGKHKNLPITTEKLLTTTKPPKNKDAHGDVRQDKRGETTARSASPQPARSHIPMRAQTMTTKKPRSQNPTVPKKSSGKT